MSLSALKHLDGAEASKALAAAALMTSVNPGVPDSQLDVQKYAQQAKAILSELRASLRLTETDDTAAARVKLGAALSKEIYRTVISSDKEQDALERMGQAGLLPNSAYTVQQSEPFTNTFYGLGVNRQGVADAIKNADETEHLLTGGPSEEHTKDISLFLKRHANHWLMVQTQRQGVTLAATSAWLIFPDVVDLTKASKLVDVLRSFVDAFGIPFKMGGKEFLFISSVDVGTLHELQEKKFEFSTGDRFFSVSFRNELGTAQVGAVYCIDLRKYKDFLLKRGVSLRRS